jgi:hypothetical protein
MLKNYSIGNQNFTGKQVFKLIDMSWRRATRHNSPVKNKTRLEGLNYWQSLQDSKQAVTDMYFSHNHKVEGTEAMELKHVIANMTSEGYNQFVMVALEYIANNQLLPADSIENRLDTVKRIVGKLAYVAIDCIFYAYHEGKKDYRGRTRAVQTMSINELIEQEENETSLDIPAIVDYDTECVLRATFEMVLNERQYKIYKLLKDGFTYEFICNTLMCSRRDVSKVKEIVKNALYM